ncbi:hypothetical protein AB0P21_07585 [Kribbella sp. NPDC056861]|uniref:hypothetical protein n=1 Tax=Kribbella sp. NPDC056861 TaxID=3154857 RepID=UPI003430CBAC
MVAVAAVLAGSGVFVGVRHLLLAGSFCPLRFDTEKVPHLADFGGRTAAYAGPGPHSLASYSAEGLTPAIFKMEAAKPSAEGLPDSWNARYDGGEPVDVQLLLCAYDKQYSRDAMSGDHVDKVSEVLGQCEGYRYLNTTGYHGSSIRVPVRAAPVTYLLYEAATQRLLTKFTLVAEDFTQADCPYTAPSDEEPVIWLSPKSAEVEAALKPFVEVSR